MDVKKPSRARAGPSWRRGVRRRGGGRGPAVTIHPSGDTKNPLPAVSWRTLSAWPCRMSGKRSHCPIQRRPRSRTGSRIALGCFAPRRPRAGGKAHGPGPRCSANSARERGGRAGIRKSDSTKLGLPSDSHFVGCRIFRISGLPSHLPCSPTTFHILCRPP